MSQYVQTAIWKFAPHKGNTLLVFLALGDWADDDGEGWAMVEPLAKKSRQSERNVQYALRQLTLGGYVEWQESSGRGRKTAFRIKVHKLHPLAAENGARKGAKRDSAIRNIQNHTKPPISPFRKANPDCTRCMGTGLRGSYSQPGKAVECECVEEQSA